MTIHVQTIKQYIVQKTNRTCITLPYLNSKENIAGGLKTTPPPPSLLYQQKLGFCHKLKGTEFLQQTLIF